MTREQKRKIRILGKDEELEKKEIHIKAQRETEKIFILEEQLYSFCLNCNKKIEQKDIGRKRKSCSDKCRHEYGSKNNNRKKYGIICEDCGKKFKALSIKRKYCSHDCYIRNKYWRQEDAEEMLNKILVGKKVESLPKWLKDLLGL